MAFRTAVVVPFVTLFYGSVANEVGGRALAPLIRSRKVRTFVFPGEIHDRTLLEGGFPHPDSYCRKNIIFFSLSALGMAACR